VRSHVALKTLAAHGARRPHPMRNHLDHRAHQAYARTMCRNIHTLHNFAPPATDDEVRAAALQYVRKISGSTSPSQANAEAFEHAVDEITRVTAELLDALVTTAPPKDREVEAAKARARAQKRYATQAS
jgi:hypothetical protein